MISGIIAGASLGSAPSVGVTWNPSGKGSVNLSNGNLTATSAGVGTNYGNARSTVSGSGKKYFEIKIDAVGSGFMPGIGISNVGNASGDAEFGGSAGNVELRANGSIYKAGSITTGWTASFDVNDIFMIAVDTAAGKIWFGKNGVWLNGGNPEAGTAPASSNNVPAVAWAAIATGPAGSIGAGTAFFDDFNYSLPVGFSKL